MTLTPDDILYRDDVLVVLNKPSGMAVHKGWDRSGTYALQSTRDLIGQYVYPVHRLDRPTSGVLLFALSSEVATLAQEVFAQQQTEKRYLAIVRGITPEEGVIDHPVPTRSGESRVEARTGYHRLCTFRERYSFVEAELWTGRLHQIRRHFKHISHPLIGDTKYGKGEHNRLFREEYSLFRLALHAYKLSFPHPVTGQRIQVFAEIPQDLLKPMERMGVPEESWRALFPQMD